MLTEAGSGLTASMLRDMEAGAPIEADHVIGDLLSRGESPLLRLVYTALKVYEARRAGKAGGSGLEYDKEKVDNAVLALLSLTVWEEHDYGARAWKTFDWGVLARLYEEGYIQDPKNKAKSVILTPEGLERARQLFERQFR